MLLERGTEGRQRAPFQGRAQAGIEGEQGVAGIAEAQRFALQRPAA